MLAKSAKSPLTGDREKSQFPTRLFVVVVGSVCLGLAISAAFTVSTLLHLRDQYLSNRGREIATAIESQARGPGKRNNPEFWQALLDENYQTYADSVAFLALVDQNGKMLAGKGNPSLGSLEAVVCGSPRLYVHDLPLAGSRGPRSGISPMIAGWRLRIGMDTAGANFIRRQAVIQVMISILAIIMLIVLSRYLVRMINGFLELKAREGTEAHLKAIGTMAASLAHEIRNPLGAIKGLTQLAQEDLAPDDAAQVRLRTVVGEAERLERLVSDLLDFARPMKPKARTFDLTEALTEVKTILQSKAQDAGVQIQLPEPHSPLSVETDPGLLRQVLLNVLINAVDASPRGADIVLEAGRNEKEGGVFIHIDDRGQGLGDRDSDELFQPFVTTKARGTGLGLAVSKRIVDSLGGTITLGNNPGAGARCSIRLPDISGTVIHGPAAYPHA